MIICVLILILPIFWAGVLITDYHQKMCNEKDEIETRDKMSVLVDLEYRMQEETNAVSGYLILCGYKVDQVNALILMVEETLKENSVTDMMDIQNEFNLMNNLTYTNQFGKDIMSKLEASKNNDPLRDLRAAIAKTRDSKVDFSNINQLPVKHTHGVAEQTQAAEEKGDTESHGHY